MLGQLLKNEKIRKFCWPSSQLNCKQSNSPSTGNVCPYGRRMGVPETTTELALP